MPHPPQIPLTPQTDERNFPRWEGENAPPGRPGARYPKMLTRTVTREDREKWVSEHKRIDQNTRQEYWEESPPRVGAQMPILSTQELVDEGLVASAGEPIIARDKDDESKIRIILGLDRSAAPVIPKSTAIPIAVSQIPIAQEVFLPDFPTPSEWVEDAPVKKRGGRPKGSKNKPKPAA